MPLTFFLLCLPECVRWQHRFHYYFRPISESPFAKCVPAPPSSPEDLDFAIAYVVRKVSARGCLHRDLAGAASTDVHILDLGAADEFEHHAGVGGEGDRSFPAPPPAPVFLSLAPEKGTPGDRAMVARNLTLVLSSREPVQWMLQSRSLSGRLRVLFAGPPESRVEDLRLAPSQSLEARRLRLPEGHEDGEEGMFEALWRAATAETDVTPVSYARVDKANIITMVISRATDRGNHFSEDFSVVDVI